ncbi:hypothetical protein N8E86_01785 [Avibacterium paragallinarum]|uniref:hypothetical protein n=1 Tax=Avibacterium paragallinarum TaxID=728 RepID=UPI0021F7C171|nr:hypothetical protein [Avibacterium paragallinarum]UXN34985.1 hypothetical protein N8E86_01785 [Avibacterium paragallinarum]
MKKYLGLFLLAGLCSSPLLAEDYIVFSCFTAKGKQIALIESEGYYEYSFGKPGKPELVFKNKIVDVEARSEKWNGVGSYWEAYNLKNGQYYYVVYKSENRVSDEHEFSGGVTVSKGDKEIATVSCERF